MAFTSKYAVSLYENVAQWSGLSHKTWQELPLENFRELLGVEEGRYAAFGALNKHVVKTALREINALAPFSVTVLPIKTGKKVTHIRVAWWPKSKDEVEAAWREVNRSKVGRKARLSGRAELVTPPFASENRRLRVDRKARRQSDGDDDQGRAGDPLVDPAA